MGSALRPLGAVRPDMLASVNVAVAAAKPTGITDLVPALFLLVHGRLPCPSLRGTSFAVMWIVFDRPSVADRRLSAARPESERPSRV